ncbi:MAG TPA: class II fructose-bisphosphate aldolase [Candidatus Onthocola gallistercoris]|uniref:Class II fructose-bisphosphate aldolase n=1 Tax=Candidatus Onthocola gallistercoris TaxID=2840876 RepID=A0A9D1HEJ3_9FIRM|nr:class II fructose-bisphosphate aldolase [Candidatus Onthocola gallistercoris]
MLVTMDKILVKARKEGYGVIAPSTFSLELIGCAIEAAERKKSPLILNINLKYDALQTEQDVELFLFTARERALRANVPVAINLDHGADYKTVMRAINHGFTSVMIDASAKPFEENIAAVQEVVHAAHSIGIPVEAELGCVGMADPTFQIETKYTQSATTDPSLVAEYVERTGVDFLAVSIGNAHGPYAKNIVPHIDFELLKQIADITPIPLVLHGGSGTGDENLTKACQMGICKINVGTDLMKIATDKAIAGYEENANKGRLRFLTNYVDGYREGIEYYMDVFGSTGKA